MIPESDPRLSQWPDLAVKTAEWMQDASRIAVGSYRQVLEDGPAICDSESDSDQSDDETTQASMVRAQFREQWAQEPAQRQSTRVHSDDDDDP
jgi:hypothetical protein